MPSKESTNTNSEGDHMLKALRQIAATDSRYGLQMKEAAADAVRHILEARIDTKARNSI